jgi:hypothetical protein
VSTKVLVVDEPMATILRMSHTRELIEMFEGYIKEMPQHADYYESIIEHLKAIYAKYELVMEKSGATSH